MLVISFPASISTSDQNCCNVVDIEITLSEVENEPKSDVGFSVLHNVDTTLHNVETTLHNVGTTLLQRCFNLAWTLVKTILNPIGLVMIMHLQIDE